MGHLLPVTSWEAPRQQQEHPGISHAGVCFSAISLQGQEVAQGSSGQLSASQVPSTVAPSRRSNTSASLTPVRVLPSEQPLLDMALSADRTAGKVQAGDALPHQC